MKYSIQFFLSLFAFINLSNAFDGSGQLKESTKEVIQGLRNFNMPLNVIDCSVIPLETQKKSCASITDNFCKKLWSDKNAGNL